MNYLACPRLVPGCFQEALQIGLLKCKHNYSRNMSVLDRVLGTYELWIQVFPEVKHFNHNMLIFSYKSKRDTETFVFLF